MTSLFAVLFSLPLFAAADPFTCPPYVQAVSEHSATILWKQSGKAAATVTLKSAPDGDMRSRKVSGGRMRRIVWTGLRPYRRYHYEVTVSGVTKKGSFQTGRRPNEPFVFLVFGDTRYNVSEHLSVVEAMALEQADFVVHTGDVVHRAQQPLYERFFRIEHPILGHLPMYPALGNHELSRSWTRGRKLFDSFFDIPNRGPCMGICYSFVYGNSMFIFLDSNVPILGSRQETWAMDRLVEASADPLVEHIFVVVHHGPFSSGPHGPNWDLADSDLYDAFERFGVDVIFSGHDHVYERGRVGRVSYVVTAGGGAPLYPIRRLLSTTVVAESVFHYVRVRVSGPSVEISAHRVDGALLDWFRLGPGQVVHDGMPGNGSSRSVSHSVGTAGSPSKNTSSPRAARRPVASHRDDGRQSGGCSLLPIPSGRPGPFWILLLGMLVVRAGLTRGGKR